LADEKRTPSAEARGALGVRFPDRECQIIGQFLLFSMPPCAESLGIPGPVWFSLSPPPCSLRNVSRGTF